ncbi:Hypothetical protein CINCED_3A023219 [Cinara cedri]|uniref:Uncharacterized protein n=1 Tax=Cinara cedri TaxID=506608 RepID=A0A5E4MVZ8_9HEMI|nr:Hypothetical protein CINCED_3A023219 [Cinara cedri]
MHDLASHELIQANPSSLKMILFSRQIIQFKMISALDQMQAAACTAVYFVMLSVFSTEEIIQEVTHKNFRRLLKAAVPNIIVTRMKNAKETFPEVTHASQKSTLADPFDVKRIIVKHVKSSDFSFVQENLIHEYDTVPTQSVDKSDIPINKEFHILSIMDDIGQKSKTRDFTVQVSTGDIANP